MHTHLHSTPSYTTFLEAIMHLYVEIAYNLFFFEFLVEPICAVAWYKPNELIVSNPNGRLSKWSIVSDSDCKMYVLIRFSACLWKRFYLLLYFPDTSQWK